MIRRFLCCPWTLAVSLFVSACGSSGGSCPTGQTPQMIVSVSPKTAEANGEATIDLQAFGQDAKCQPLPEGSSITFTLTEASPAGVGKFSNGTETIVVNTTTVGASTKVTSAAAGTVKASASYLDLSTGLPLTSTPASLEFTTPIPHGLCAIELAASSPAIKADGITTTTLTATLKDDTGAAMPDDTAVDFTTDLGTFTENQSNEFQGATINSRVSTDLKSELLTLDKTANISASYKCNDKARTPKTAHVTVRFVVNVAKPQIAIAASATEVTADDVSSVDITAGGLHSGGAPVEANTPIVFTTSLGRFEESGSDTYNALTDASGTAKANFIGGVIGGVATIQAAATIESENVSDSTTVKVRQVGSIVFKSADPNKLGVKGSGKNESSRITFLVKDTSGAAFPEGATVNFKLSDAAVGAGVTLDNNQAQTDKTGEVGTTVRSGKIATTATVTATTKAGTQTIQADSPAIAIVGAKPNARWLTFSCARFNIGGLILDQVETQCTVSLADRFSNKIGFATNVTFRTEAGAITSNAVTSETEAEMGKATVTLRTGNPRPVDVLPFAATQAQPWVVNEPYIVNTSRTNNPRDGLVTIIVATTGEEDFNDLNGNGEYDLGEPFVDLGEPFIDSNDNGVYDGEDLGFIDTNNNQQYDSPNGVWDSSTNIWTQAWMLWTGHVAWYGAVDDCNAATYYSVICPSSFDIPKGGTQTFDYEIKDINLNVLNTSLAVSGKLDATKGSMASSSPPMPWDVLDSLGIDIQMIRVKDRNGDPTNSANQCPYLNQANQICYWMPYAGGYNVGWKGSFTIKGATVDDTTPNDPAAQVTLTVNYQESPGAGQQISESISVSGNIQ